MEGVSDDEMTEALLLATGVMCDIAERSLADAVTLPQYRALVALASGGPINLTKLASSLGVAPSTANRMCERLLRQKLISRERHTVDSREIVLTLTPEGQTLIDDVLERRRREARSMLRAIPREDRLDLLAALGLIASVAGDLPETHWTSGWQVKSAGG